MFNFRKFWYCDLNMADRINRNIFYSVIIGFLLAMIISIIVFHVAKLSLT